MKYSKQRELIYNAVAPNRMHPTADDIYDMLKRDNPNLSLATVYRNLNQLADNNDIIKVQIPGQKDRFDPNVHDHYHFICSECGHIYDIDKELVNMPCGISVDGHEVDDVKLTLTGVCKNCKH
ncbi:MAG: transcriptional repressor [Clostridia bacterium]|nr:transcriptional repressor [Clostridia bacterium]